MKRLILRLLITTLIALGAVSCKNTNDVKENVIRIPSVSTIDGYQEIAIINIDGCYYYSGYRLLTHKGNCSNHSSYSGYE